MAEVLGYAEKRREDQGREGRWGVYNYDADRWLDIHFGSEREAAQAAGFLMKTRVRPTLRL